MSEAKTYRLELEQIVTAFPDKVILTRKEVSQYTGRGRRWMDSHGFKGREFTRAFVAKALAAINEEDE